MGHAGNGTLVMEGPEPSTTAVLTIQPRDYAYKLVTGLELNKWYHFYALATENAGENYILSVYTSDLTEFGAPPTGNPVLYPFGATTKWAWSAPFEPSRQADRSFGVSSSIPSKTIYVFSVWITSPGDTTPPPDPNPHDLPQRPPICNGALIQIPIGGGSYFCPTFTGIAFAAVALGIPILALYGLYKVLT